MAYIPKDAEWFIADIVIEINVEDELENVLHVNTILIQASTPEDAYEKAIKLGKESEDEPYKNPNGKTVTSIFKGLDNLDVIHDKLEHGAELYFSEYTNVPTEKIKEYITRKEELSIFSDITPSQTVDYSSGEITETYNKSKDKETS